MKDEGGKAGKGGREGRGGEGRRERRRRGPYVTQSASTSLQREVRRSFEPTIRSWLRIISQVDISASEQQRHTSLMRQVQALQGQGWGSGYGHSHGYGFGGVKVSVWGWCWGWGWR